MRMGVLEAAQDYAGFVLFEIFDRLGDVAALPQATTAPMKHYMQALPPTSASSFL